MKKHNLSLEERFLSYVNISYNSSDCWIWIGSKFRTGYGSFCINYKTYRSHRVSYALFVGMIPDGMEVCHSCDNRACVNPKHLFLGTHQDNMNDKSKKNRNIKPKGEDNGNHKLTKQQVHQILGLIERECSQKEIAKMFGVSDAQISHIKSGKRWGWLK